MRRKGVPGEKRKRPTSLETSIEDDVTSTVSDPIEKDAEPGVVPVPAAPSARSNVGEPQLKKQTGASSLAPNSVTVLSSAASSGGTVPRASATIGTAPSYPPPPPTAPVRDVRLDINSLSAHIPAVSSSVVAQPVTPTAQRRLAPTLLATAMKREHGDAGGGARGDDGALGVQCVRVADIGSRMGRKEIKEQKRADEGVTSQMELREIVARCVYPSVRSVSRIVERDRLPGPLPSTLRRAHLRTLDPRNYWMCEKSDGERAMLLLTCTGAWLADRKFHFQHLRQWPDNGEPPTLVDGELVQSLLAPPSVSASLSLVSVPSSVPSSLASTSTLHPPSACPVLQQGDLARRYLIFDAVMLRGTSVVDALFESRMIAFCSAFAPKDAETRWPALAQLASVLVVKCKKFVRLGDAAYQFSKIQATGRDEYEYRDLTRGQHHRNDGIVLTPNAGGYLCAELPLLKWKWPGLNTLDFKIVRPFFDRKGDLQLYAGGPNDTDVLVGTTEMTNQERARLLQDVAERYSDRATVVVECAYAPDESRFVVKGCRTDKTSANYITVVFATQQTIIDNVTKDQIVAAFGGRH